MTRPRVVIFGGYGANYWTLNPWERLLDEFDVSYLKPKRGLYDTSMLSLPAIKATTVRDLLPPGRLGDIAGYVLKDRYLRIGSRLDGVDIVHAGELGFWYSRQAAELKKLYGFKLALTVWETLPFMDTYRHFLHTRRARRAVMEATDLFLPATERAKLALLLEGVPEEKITVCEPGIDLDLFRPLELEEPCNEHTVLSIGRLVWDKGHQDVLRAVSAIKRGYVPAPAVPRAVIVGQGPERARLEQYAKELGIGGMVEFRGGVPHDQVPELHAKASCLVLASLPIENWEEQFGYVLVEAMATKLWVVASTSGAIPSVAGQDATYFAPGDWVGLAEALAKGPLSAPPASRREPTPGQLEKFSAAAMAERLRAAYRGLLKG